LCDSGNLWSAESTLKDKDLTSCTVLLKKRNDEALMVVGVTFVGAIRGTQHSGLFKRTREGSRHSIARTLTAKPERLKVQDCLRYNDWHVLDRLGHRRQSVFDRLSETYSPSTTKSRPDRTSCKDHPRGRSCPHRLDASNKGRLENKERFRSVGGSYDDSHFHSYHDRDRFRHMKRIRASESPLSIVSRSDSSDGRYQKSKSKRHKPTDEDDLTMPWMCEEVERWAMPTWCHMFNSTLIRAARVWFDELPQESIDSYKDLKAAFLAYFMQQKKYVKDLVKIHNIKQKDGETIEDFMERINNPELKKRFNEHVPKTMEEMMNTTTAFIRGEAAAASKKKGRGTSRFTPLTRTPKEILAAEAGKFQPPPPMGTSVEKRSSNKFCDFHNDKRHSTDECMQLKKQIEELVRAGKLSHLIKEIKHGRDQEITFPPLATSSGAEGPFVIEAEISGHMIHRMYVDGGSSMEICCEHCFNRLRPEVKNQMVSATTSLIGFSGETIWPLGQLSLLVTIEDADHSIRAWMNFMIVRSLSPYNGIVGRPGIKKFKRTIFKVALHPNFPDQEIAIRGMLSAKGRTKLCSLLKENLDIFAWQPSDMTGAPERAKAIQAEVQKLVEAGIMREVYYHDWLSNPVMVKKHDGSWRMCVDFTDLNKACPQDCYPLLEIDWKVESLCGYPFKCFLDAYKGYHQIQLAESDEEKTAFHTVQGVYCYTKMPFGLKNDGATYQRLVDEAFDSQIGWNIEVYVDDLVVKSHTEVEMLRDIGEMFRTLRKINMKLNPQKCTFGAVEGMFLGYMVTPEGINYAFKKRNTYHNYKKFLPLFKTLKKCIKKSDFYWTSEAEHDFKQLKQHLSELPLLVAPKPKEELIVYLSTSYGAISAVLMTERGTIQTPVYFISRIIQGPKLNYTPMEKLVLSLVFAAKRLRRYFQAHPIAVITDQPIKQTMSRPDVSCVDGSGARLILTSPEGTEFTYALRFQFAASNNEAGYEALIAGLRIAAQNGVQNVHVCVDSKLVANQVLWTYVAKEENMIKYLEKVKSLVLVETLKEKSIQEKDVTIVVEEDGPTRMTPIMKYLKEETLPSDRKEARKLCIKARQYELLEEVLYRRVIPYVVVKVRRTTPSEALTPIMAPWLFYKWGIDIAGPFSEGPGKVKFLIVAMDYFIKWIEAKAAETITSSQSNGLVERANRSLGEGIKARLGEGNKNWVEELPHVLWAHRTMIKSSHGNTPFSLTYETEAVIPAEIGMPTYRTAAVDVLYNDEELRLNLDLLEERRNALQFAKPKPS
nr:hypothetical protein [Tanacetum cinerariifolium]